MVAEGEEETVGGKSMRENRERGEEERKRTRKKVE